jgi:hypothetical protein
VGGSEKTAWRPRVPHLVKPRKMKNFAYSSAQERPGHRRGALPLFCHSRAQRGICCPVLHQTSRVWLPSFSVGLFLPEPLTYFLGARYPSGKGEVCKTFMRRFDSDPRLQTTSESPKTSNPQSSVRNPGARLHLHRVPPLRIDTSLNRFSILTAHVTVPGHTLPLMTPIVDGDQPIGSQVRRHFSETGLQPCRRFLPNGRARVRRLINPAEAAPIHPATKNSY